ncbi:MAG: hypothetical protein KAR20_07205, partial [Candidatus Heimdallarchaeota archaeon]|nr:hypothetical protein [Candidatus Heimdallarchaeota archaeon]
GWKNVDVAPRPLSTADQRGGVQASDLVMVHRTDFLPENGIMRTRMGATGETGRDTIHFSLNHAVKGHMYGNWDQKKYTILIPVAKIPKGKIEGFNFVDTWVRGNLELPEGTIVLGVSQGNTDLGKARFRNTAKSREAIEEVISEMGYTPVQGGTWGWEGSGWEEREAHFAKAEHLKGGSHADHWSHDFESMMKPYSLVSAGNKEIEAHHIVMGNLTHHPYNNGSFKTIDSIFIAERLSKFPLFAQVGLVKQYGQDIKAVAGLEVWKEAYQAEIPQYLVKVIVSAEDALDVDWSEYSRWELAENDLRKDQSKPSSDISFPNRLTRPITVEAISNTFRKDNSLLSSSLEKPQYFSSIRSNAFDSARRLTGLQLPSASVKKAGGKTKQKENIRKKRDVRARKEDMIARRKAERIEKFKELSDFLKGKPAPSLADKLIGKIDEKISNENRYRLDLEQAKELHKFYEEHLSGWDKMTDDEKQFADYIAKEYIFNQIGSRLSNGLLPSENVLEPLRNDEQLKQLSKFISDSLDNHRIILGHRVIPVNPKIPGGILNLQKWVYQEPRIFINFLSLIDNTSQLDSHVDRVVDLWLRDLERAGLVKVNDRKITDLDGLRNRKLITGTVPEKETKAFEYLRYSLRKASTSILKEMKSSYRKRRNISKATHAGISEYFRNADWF